MVSAVKCFKNGLGLRATISHQHDDVVISRQHNDRYYYIVIASA
jgi:hypothetical protein